MIPHASSSIIRVGVFGFPLGLCGRFCSTLLCLSAHRLWEHMAQSTFLGGIKHPHVQMEPGSAAAHSIRKYYLEKKNNQGFMSLTNTGVQVLNAFAG